MKSLLTVEEQNKHVARISEPQHFLWGSDGVEEDPDTSAGVWDHRAKSLSCTFGISGMLASMIADAKAKAGGPMGRADNRSLEQQQLMSN